MSATIIDIVPAPTEPEPVATQVEIDLSRNAVIKAIKTALESRSGLKWSVTGGKGTAYGWIEITAPPKRRGQYGYIQEPDRSILRALLNLDSVHCQGVSIPSGHDYYREYMDRAAGRTPQKLGVPYWD